MKNKKGFTLVEVLVVIAIIGILALLILPNFVSSFRNAKDKAMITQENEVVDAVKLFIEDYCRHPLSQNKGQCSNYSIPTSDVNRRYTCLSTLQNTKYIDDIISQGEACTGFIIYNTNYSGYKSYLQCGSGYQTEGTSEQKDSNGLNIIDICGGTVTPPTPTQPTTTQHVIAGGTLMQASSEGNETSNFLRTTVIKNNIEIITFTNSISGHSPNGTDCWDVSAEENGSVLAWASDVDSNGKFEITIGANGKVYASSGRDLFAYLNSLTSMNGMVYFDTSNVTNMNRMFSNCSSLTSLDLSNFNTSNVTNMVEMFLNCSSLTSLSLNSFNTSNVTNMTSMFSNCSSLTSLDLKNEGFNTSNVTNMSQMFLGCKGLTSLDLSGSNFDTSNVTNMGLMFGNCSGLTSLDLTHSNFNTSNVTNMSSMFFGCTGLTAINLSTSNFDTSNVTNMNGLFSGCTGLTSLNLKSSNFDTSNVTNMASMFNNCDGLTTIDLTGSNFDTSNVTNMSYMFADCDNLTTLNLASNFDTSNVTTMQHMFIRDKSLVTLDLTIFETPKVTDMSAMFYACSKLTTIYASSSFVTTNVTNSDNMFFASTKIVGGAGTVYDYNHVDKEYARIDEGTTNPGYFTDKNATKLTATFYYNSNTTSGSLTVATATATCSARTGGSCTVSVPSVVSNSVGKYNSAYKGVSTSTGNMNNSSLTISSNTTYYANYSKRILLYYYDSDYKSAYRYRNEYFSSATAMVSRLSNSENGTSNYTTAGGPGSSIWKGLSTESDTTAEYTTVQTAANSNSGNLYSIYEFRVSYLIGTGVSGIGSDSASCYVTSTSKSCIVVLPTITPKTGYSSVGWSTTSGATNGTSAMASYTINEDSTKLYANAKANSYTVTFNVNNGTAWTSSTCKSPSTFTSSGSKCTKSVTYDSTYGTLPTPTRTGYTFDGWYTTASGGSKKTSSSAVAITADQTLYAHWTGKTITVTFYRNQSSSDTTTRTQTFTYGSSGTRKFGYDSDGNAIWGTSGDFGGWTYSNHKLLGWSTNRSATTSTWDVYSGVTDNWINTNAPSINIYGIWKANCDLAHYRNCPQAKLCYPNDTTSIASTTSSTSYLEGTISTTGSNPRAKAVYYIGPVSGTNLIQVVVETRGYCDGLQNSYKDTSSGCTSSDQNMTIGFTPNHVYNTAAYVGYAIKTCVAPANNVPSTFSQCSTGGTYYCQP